MLAVITSVSAAAKAKQTVLVLDGDVTHSNCPSGTGSIFYVEGDIYAKGQIETGPIIGKFHDAYAPNELGSFMSQSVWRISGSGDIWIVYFFDDDQTPKAQGIIIGGAGKYQGASGQISEEIISENPFIVRATFVFEKAIKP